MSETKVRFSKWFLRRRHLEADSFCLLHDEREGTYISLKRIHKEKASGEIHLAGHEFLQKDMSEKTLYSELKAWYYNYGKDPMNKIIVVFVVTECTIHEEHRSGTICHQIGGSYRMYLLWFLQCGNKNKLNLRIHSYFTTTIASPERKPGPRFLGDRRRTDHGRGLTQAKLFAVITTAGRLWWRDWSKRHCFSAKSRKSCVSNVQLLSVDCILKERWRRKYISTNCGAGSRPETLSTRMLSCCVLSSCLIKWFILY